MDFQLPSQMRRRRHTERLQQLLGSMGAAQQGLQGAAHGIDEKRLREEKLKRDQAAAEEQRDDRLKLQQSHADRIAQQFGLDESREKRLTEQQTRRFRQQDEAAASAKQEREFGFRVKSMIEMARQGGMSEEDAAAMAVETMRSAGAPMYRAQAAGADVAQGLRAAQPKPPSEMDQAKLQGVELSNQLKQRKLSRRPPAAGRAAAGVRDDLGKAPKEKLARIVTGLKGTRGRLAALMGQKPSIDTGPIANLYQKANAQLFGGSREATRFKAKVANELNKYVKELSGATVTGNEEVRLSPAIPSASDNDAVFEEKLAAWVEFLDSRVAEELAAGRAQGIDPRHFDDPVAAEAREPGGRREPPPASTAADVKRILSPAQKRQLIGEIRALEGELGRDLEDSEVVALARNNGWVGFPEDFGR